MPSGSISASCSTGGIRSCASTSAAKRAPSRPNAARSLSRSCAWCHAKAHNGAGGYGLRGWIECGFKDGKRGGWNWQRCRSRQPERVERLWLAMAVATLITVGVGAEREAHEPLPCLEQVPLKHIARRNAQAAQQRAEAAGKPSQAKPKRVLSCFNRGCRLLMRLVWRLQEKLSFSLPVEPWPHLPALPVEGGFWGTG